MDTDKPSLLLAVLTTSDRWVYPSIMEVVHHSSGWPMVLMNQHGIFPHSAARNQIVTEFLQVRLNDKPLDWLMMLDNDMDPPADLLDVLLRRDVEGKDILAMKCYRYAQDVGREGVDVAWKPVNGKLPRRPWLELEHAGTGAMFIRRNVLEIVRPPWFHFGLYEDGSLAVGEDYYFSGKAREAGFKIWGLDEDRYEVGHIKNVNLSCIAPALKRIGNVPAPQPPPNFPGKGARSRQEWRFLFPNSVAAGSVERNAPCQCGSGKKFKKCCGV